MQGILLIDKPEGFTSFDVLASLRKPLGTKKLGHTGTLDPMATGVLPVLVGRATKLCSLLPDSDKTYVAGFKFGYSTDTLDRCGQTTKTTDVLVSKEDVLRVLPDFTGSIMQVPPMYSALKVDGVKLHKLARQGIEVKREARPINIYEISLIEFDETTQEGIISVSCSSGTYIRSLIDDIAKAINTLGVMTSLRRTTSHGFDISDCIELDKVRNGFEASMLLPVDSVLKGYPQINVTPAQAIRFYNGGALDVTRTPLDDGYIGFVRVKNREGQLLGLGFSDKNNINIKCLFDLGE
ncbi:MAG: tRNA pseudouridine(55) synthase TruB [Clostridia bacterium]|nr:tRNA pseudouridine(55) synthase TruB [Clostridia bacterium]